MINSLLTDTILSQILDCTTSQDVWSTLYSMFSAQSSAHVMQTQFQVATLKKGFKTITQCFYQDSALSASLSASGKPLTSSKFLTYLLAGLGTNFESLVTFHNHTA